MNRYEAEGVLSDALAGKTVVVVDAFQRQVLEQIDTAVKRTPKAEACIDVWRHTVGRMDITFKGGGRILVRGGRADNLRGHTADVVLIDESVRYNDHDLTVNAQCVVATSPHGEVIR